MANLLLLIKRNKIWVALGILMTILSNLSQMTFVYLIGKLVNHIESHSSIKLSFILLIALLMATNAFTLLLKQYIGRLSTEKMAHSLRMGYAKRLIKKTVKEKTSASLAMSVAQNELAQANNYLSNTLFDIAGMLIMALLVTAYLLLQNVLLTLVIIVPTLLILVYVSFSSRRLSTIVSLAQNEKNKMNKVAYSLIHAFPSVKIFSGEKLCLNAYNESFDVWEKQWKKNGPPFCFIQYSLRCVIENSSSSFVISRRFYGYSRRHFNGYTHCLCNNAGEPFRIDHEPAKLDRQF